MFLRLTKLALMMLNQSYDYGYFDHADNFSRVIFDSITIINSFFIAVLSPSLKIFI